MSHIPNSAMPHAGQSDDQSTEASTGTDGRTSRLSDLGTGIADKVREYPKTAAAAGVAVTAGLVAAAAIPAMRARGRSSGKKND